MNSIKSVLVHLDGTECSSARLLLAHRLAVLHKAALDGLFAAAPRATASALDCNHRAATKALFERTAGTGAPSGSWHELESEPLVQGFVRQALLADLLVLGQRHPTDANVFDVPADFVESVILGSGRPALILPHAGEVAADPRTVLVGWNPTRSSARAVTASLPWLKRARSVHVYCSAESIVDTHQALVQLERYLRLHGIDPAQEHRGDAHTDIGGDLLSLAADIGAEMLVMGCYGHTRTRELLLGGASRTVLGSMTLPVLMVH